tara:strand:- start:1459 stop:2004 length:546 start_codon:yes stop_codon:yes gene_type:complete
MACIASTIPKSSDSGLSQITEESIGKESKNEKMSGSNKSDKNLNAKQSEFDSFKESDPNQTELGSFESARDIRDIYFKFDQFTLTENAKDVLRKTSDWLKKNPSVKAKLEGHCDVRGTNNYNLSLGNKRAESVKDVLVALGVVGDRLMTISYGEEKPVCFENNENCWKKNRRVHFMISSDN